MTLGAELTELDERDFGTKMVQVRLPRSPLFSSPESHAKPRRLP
jgi:hypothetical protein